MRFCLIEMNTSIDPVNADALRRAAEFYAKELGILDLDIELKVQLYQTSKDISSIEKASLRGRALFRRPAEGIVQLVVGKYTITEIAITLAHEMVHIKQFAKEGLKIDRSIPYNERPWEIEAMSKQFPLFTAFLKSVKEGNR